ncbi:apolipoprotein N-acyltransferase [Caldimonas brevitalea]|uniref:Apolipoprotein N-acyltransferase n=1 Tax=Caldimonas brevitalea TaxID=413882 RepID=A0A0G3BXZ5_9BURK|nr:apolipoprotein N-acyltransferase [Caldimonas brevitalea]AKJ31405.1 acyltransferase [Caldimonas brevitalea]
MPLWAELLVVAAGGYGHAVSFSNTSLWWLQLLALAVLAWRVQRCPTAARAAACGWVFGTAWLVGATWWLYISMHDYGLLPAPLAAAAVLLLAAFLSLYLAAAMALYHRVAAASRLWSAPLFAAAWLLGELARGYLFTGFPWAASGYAHVDGPLATLAPWVGVYGIGFVAAWLAAALGGLTKASARPRAWAPLLSALGLCVAASGVNHGFTVPTGKLTVALLQGNVPQDEKFSQNGLAQALQWYADELEAATADLVITPETAIPLLPQQLPADYWQGRLQHFVKTETAALVGIPLGDFETGYTNSVLGLARARAEPYRYDKHHLVPFGEFIPLGFRWFVNLMNMPLGDFSRGSRNPPSFPVQGERVAPNICYEDLFGEELAVRFGQLEQAPTIFANISNIAWFGNTVAVYQHLQISRMRALEFQIPMLRATNTGATAIIDHTGRVTQELKPFTRGVLTGPVQGRTGLTPFARWASAAGLWPLLVLGLALLGAAFVWRRRAA